MSSDRREKWLLYGLIPVLASIVGSVTTVTLQSLIDPSSPPAQVSATAPPAGAAATSVQAQSIAATERANEKPWNPWPYIFGATIPAVALLIASVARWIDRQP